MLRNSYIYPATLCTALLAGFLNTVTAAQARVIIKETTKYYSISGRDGSELYISMLENAPKLDGIRGHALASTEFEFIPSNLKIEVRNNRCVVTKADVIMKVKYTYPKWNGSKKASKQTRSAWKNFIKTAKWHEQQHTKISREYANSLEQLIKSSRRRASSDCETSTWSEAFKASRIVRTLNRKHKQFDRQDLSSRGRGYKAQSRLVQAR